MRTSIQQKIKEIMMQHSKNNYWQKIAACMAAIVAVLTVSVLVMPAAALGHDAYCGLEEHQHSEECYERQLVCGKEEKQPAQRVFSCPLEVHQHQESCYDGDGALICGYADFMIHEHADHCYDEDGVLICTLPEVKEHQHDSSCYTEEKKLVCTEEETAGHTHAKDCYTLTETGNINCTAPDEEGHVHTDECYEKAEMLTCGIEETSGHIHTDNCYETIRNYTCGKEEIILHKHDDKCYSTDENGRKYLSCGRLETYEHEHDENCFQEVQAENDTHMHTEECYADVAVCGVQEHTHADQCFEPTAEEAEFGQTESIVEETESVQMEGMVEGTVFAQTESMAEETESGYSVENAADDLLSDTELKPYLQSVTIQDGNGTLVDGTVYVGESYKIRLVFAETKGGTQFNADIDTWTYQLPSGIKVAEAQNQKMTITITENNVTKAYETTYSIDTNGLITVHLNDALKEAVIVVPNASFDINLNAEVSGDQAGEGAEIVFEGSSDGIKFNTSIRPSLSVAKSVEQEEYKDDHNNSIGGKLSYTVTGNVVNGPVKGMTFVDAGGYSQDYFGKAEEIRDKLQITSVVIRCGEDQENHQKILTADDYSLSWEGSKFTLQINENIQMNDCDTIEMKYTIPYQAAKGVSYYKFDVDNTVTFSGTTVQPDPSDPVKGEPEPDEATNQTTVSGGTAGIRGMVKTIDDKDYDTQGVLHYTVKVDVSAGNYWPFYMWDDLSVLLDGETYRVDAALKNMKIRIKDADGVRDMINLNEQDPDWLYHLNNAAYPCPTGDYFAHLGKGVNGNWKNPGAYDIVFNPVGCGDWYKNTSLNLPKDSEIEVTYDIDVDEEIGLYTYDDKKLDKKIKLRDYLSENGGAAILRNYVQMNGGGQWSGSKIDYSRGKKLRKTAVENQDGTIDYSVTLLVDEAVREKLKDGRATYNWLDGLDVDFYDEFQQGWEYVEGTLTGTIDLGTWAPTFYYLDYFDESEYDKNFMNTVTGNKVSPAVKGSHAIHASWNGFGELKNGTVNVGWNLARCLRKDNDTYLNKLIGVTFNYKLRPTEEVGKNLSDKDTVNVHNEAAIRVNGANVYEAKHDLTYAPKHLSKTAKQNGNGSNVIAFEIDINRAGVDLNPDGSTIQVTDTMGANLTLKPGSLYVLNADGNTIPVTDYSMTSQVIGETAGKKQEQFTLSGLPDNRHLTICYEALLKEQGDDITVENTASIVGIAETKLDDDTKFSVNRTSAGGQGSVDYFTLRKVDQDNESKMLEGAVFEVYAATQDNEETGSTEGIFEFGEGDFAKKYTARRIGEFMTDADGQVEVKGDDIEIDRYYILKEVTAPKGYIRSEQPILVYFAGAKDVPEDVDKNAEIIGYSYSYTVKNETYKVERPETGGIGTTVFYAAGGILLAGAVVLLIARKRTNCMKK